MTNVRATQLSYSRYSRKKYDKDIVNAIPFHGELHEEIAKYIAANLDPSRAYEVLEMGVGSGITATLIKELLPLAHIDAVDFSGSMLDHARKKLGQKNVSFILGDYSKLRFTKRYDIVVSVIGLHHQHTAGKKKVFNKIHKLLTRNGVFIFGDLVTHRNQRIAALNHALHYHHLVKYAANKKALAEWAHHHIYLNDLAAIEDQEDWLRMVGFTVQRVFLKTNTALLICKK